MAELGEREEVLGTSSVEMAEPGEAVEEAVSTRKTLQKVALAGMVAAEAVDILWHRLKGGHHCMVGQEDRVGLERHLKAYLVLRVYGDLTLEM
jgi:hypothetical protein